MNSMPELALEDRIVTLLQTLGLQRAHFAVRPRGPRSLGGLVEQCAEQIASLASICTPAVSLTGIAQHAGPFLCVYGAGNPRMVAAVNALKSANTTVHPLDDYREFLWTDLLVERPEIGDALLDFLETSDSTTPLAPAALGEGEGEVAGITYRVQGSGPPLVLFPLDLAPSQWEPLLPRLNSRYTTIVVGGAHLDPVANHYGRASSGYGSMVMRMLREAGAHPGHSLIEVGCGSGALLRQVVAMLGPTSHIAGLDFNRFFLREAARFAQREEWGPNIAFHEGSALAIPLPDDGYDFVLCSTVLEEVDADRAIAEMVRITKPGGKVVAVVRAADRSSWLSLPISAALRQKLEGGGGGNGSVVERGCADASLYQRLADAGLGDLHLLPQMAAARITDGWGRSLTESTLAGLKGADADEWRSALERIERDNLPAWTARPFHCAFGTKPA